MGRKASARNATWRRAPLQILALLTALCAAAVLPALPLRAEPLALSTQLVGGRFDYLVQPGDSLTQVSSRFGVDLAPLAERNGLSPAARLRVGQTLQIENPHLVPARAGEPFEDGIVINVPQRQLFHLHGGRAIAAYPVGLGRPTWRTPMGEFTITRREVDKPWVVPPSIQAEMRRAGQPVRELVPPGPENPLGRHWLGLSPGSCGIHGTTAPPSVYRFQTHGCIRLHPDDVAGLFEQVGLGERVEILYEPLLLGALDDGRVLLEVHRDVYRRAGDPGAALAGLAAETGLGERIDWALAQRAISRAEGLATEITRATPLPPGPESGQGRAQEAPR